MGWLTRIQGAKFTVVDVMERLRVKPLIMRLIKILVLAELIYLVLFNLALNWPMTQTLVNQIKPDKFIIYWENAWTWYPFRVHGENISVNGQSKSQQWQVDIASASGSIRILPLIFRTVQISNVSGTDTHYFQRPRLKPDGDYSSVLEHFPPIRDRKIEKAVTGQKKKRKPWDIVIDGIQANGNHAFWVYQLKGTASGNLQADLNFQTNNGPFSLNNGTVDIVLESLTTNGNRKIVNEASIRGNAEIAPIVFKENKGIKTLPFLNLDIDFQGAVDNLAFLNLYLGDIHGMQVDGRGTVDGHLKFDRGRLLPGTDLSISAPMLSISLLSHRAEGSGDMDLVVRAEQPEILNLAVEFAQLSAYYNDSSKPLFIGDSLVMSATGKTTLPEPGKNNDQQMNNLAVTIPSVRVPDISVYQRYIPQNWDFMLHGGEGSLHASAELTGNDFHADLNLASTMADVGIDEYRFQSNLDVGVKVAAPSFTSALIDVSGTYLRLGDSKLTVEEAGASNEVQTDLVIEKGVLNLRLPELGENAEPEALFQTIKNYDLNKLLSVSDAELRVTGNMSDFSWITLLFRNNYDLEINGAGKVDIDATLESGWPAKGSRIEVTPERLMVGILDYAIQGEGEVEMEVLSGGENPDVQLNLAVVDASMKRRNDEKAVIEEVKVKINALGKNMSYQGPSEDLQLHLQIPSAKVTDMSVFNSYFPDKLPLELIDGKADLVSDIKLEPDDVSGFVKLTTRDLVALLDDQEISADLAVDIKLSDGVPENLDFDISGSNVRLDNVKVSGEEKDFYQDDWHINFDLNRGRAVWKKPVSVFADADLVMKDTRPFVTVLANYREKHGWLEKLLTIENVEGDATLNMAQDQIIIPHAFVDSDKVDLGAKGIFDQTNRNGVFYARFGKLEGLLKITDGENNFDVIKAREKFDAYSPGDMAPSP